MWEMNPNAKSLPQIAVGDIVHLKQSGPFDHLVKVKVSNIGADEIEGIIDGVFDWHGKGQVVGGDPVAIVGKVAQFRPAFVHEVIKPPGAR